MTYDRHVNTFIDAILEGEKVFAMIMGEFHRVRF